MQLMTRINHEKALFQLQSERRLRSTTSSSSTNSSASTTRTTSDDGKFVRDCVLQHVSVCCSVLRCVV